MRRMYLALSCGAALFLTGCGERHAVDVTQPDAAALDAALKRFVEMTPKMRIGRWEVAVSVPGVKLEGVDKQTADELRAWGKARNTTARCRKVDAALDYYAEIQIKVSLRPGCAVERLTADPGELAWTSHCTMGNTTSTDDTRIRTTPESFVTLRTSTTSYNGKEGREKRRLQYDGRYAGECRGDEVIQPTFWSDPR